MIEMFVFWLKFHKNLFQRFQSLGDGLVPNRPGNKPLPEPKMIQIYVAANEL